MKHAHTISWVLFALLGAGTLAASLGSVMAAYVDPSPDLIAGKYTPAEVANGDEEVAAALSARRGTAAAFAFSYAILLLSVAIGPYRKRVGVRGAFVALVVASVANAVVILLRVPLLGVSFGLGTATIPLVLVVIAAVCGLLAQNLSAPAEAPAKAPAEVAAGSG